jgi:hypothetical protein
VRTLMMSRRVSERRRRACRNGAGSTDIRNINRFDRTRLTPVAAAVAAQQPETLARIEFASAGLNRSDPLAMWRRSSPSQSGRMIHDGECPAGSNSASYADFGIRRRMPTFELCRVGCGAPGIRGHSGAGVRHSRRDSGNVRSGPCAPVSGGLARGRPC